MFLRSGKRSPAALAGLFLVAVGLVVWSTSVPRPVNRVREVGARLDLDGAKIRGNQYAKLVVIEFSDFTCRFCGLFAREVQPGLLRDFVDTGLVQWAFRHLALGDGEARLPAHAAECAAEQGAFWRMHDVLFKVHPGLSTSELNSHAGLLGLNLPRFQSCLGSWKADILTRDVEIAESLSITGTPTFAFGRRSTTGSITLERVVRGIMSGPVFSEVIAHLLRETQ